MKQRAWTILVLLVLIACNNASKTNSEAVNVPADIMNDDEERDWLTKLYDNYVENPKTQEQIDENLIIDYVADNQIQVKRTASGLYYQILKEGEGELLKMGAKVSANYKGYYTDGHIFDSSASRGRPINFSVGQMVAGWNEGLLYLKKGAKAKFLIPSRLGYGARGFPGFVEPNKVLVFEIEIL